MYAMIVIINDNYQTTFHCYYWHVWASLKLEANGYVIFFKIVIIQARGSDFSRVNCDHPSFPALLWISLSPNDEEYLNLHQNIQGDQE